MEIKNYDIRPVTELLDLRERTGVVSDFQDENTHAFIFELINGQIILLPAVGSKGLLVNTKGVLNEILATRIPLQDDHRQPHLEKQHLIVNLPHSVDTAIETINKNLGTAINLQDLNFDVEDLNKRIRKYGSVKAYEELSIELGILLCELIRRKDTNVKYELKKSYGYNPYYDAVLIDSEGAMISPWYYLNRYLIGKKKFDFKEIQYQTERFRI